MTQQKGTALQDPFLNTLRKERIPVSIYLVNGIKLQGQIESFDPFVVLLRNSVSQLIYKHAISTIVPARGGADSGQRRLRGARQRRHRGLIQVAVGQRPAAAAGTAAIGAR